MSCSHNDSSCLLDVPRARCAGQVRICAVRWAWWAWASRYTREAVLFLTHAHARAAQGKSAFARLGGNARVVGLVGMGKQEKATPIAEWGPSAYQA